MVIYLTGQAFKEAVIRFLLSWPMYYGEDIERHIHYTEYAKANRN